MNAQISVKTKRSVPMLLLGPLIIALLSSFNPVAFFSNACVSPFASAYDRAVALDSYGDKTGAIAAYSEHLRDQPDHLEVADLLVLDRGGLGIQTAWSDCFFFDPHRRSF